MSGDFRIRVESDVVFVVESGRLDFDASNHAIVLAVEAAKAASTKCLLFDVRDADLSNYYSYIVRHADMAADTGIDAGFSIAVVGRPDATDVLSFIELVARNRGWRAKCFYDPDKALAWLRGAGAGAAATRGSDAGSPASPR
ncbi:MAG TPA: hypothetical protein VEB41_14265 [Burkholderiales bacterium]|nr:hypothetical protein [Burkholderiales bacterium]